jgi:thermitase
MRVVIKNVAFGKGTYVAFVGFWALIVGAALIFGASPLQAQDAPEGPLPTQALLEGEAWPGEYIVAVDQALAENSVDGVTVDDLLAVQAQMEMAADMVDQVAVCGSTTTLQVWRLRDPNMEALFQRFVDEPGVRFIEPNWIVRAAGVPPTPPVLPEQPYPFTDTFYASRQWPMQRSSFARAWQLVQEQQLPTRKVRVAVIDSGVDFNHPDLAGRLLTGKNYITSGAWPDDDYGHGTHVTGIIAAVAKNARGIAGGAPNVEIDSLKMLDGSGNGLFSNLVRAICDAADRDAAVINMSLEVGLSISLDLAAQMQSAVDYAYASGALLVAAAGNSSNGAQLGPVYYPARLNHVIAVAALTPENTRATYSAVGTQLDIAAGGGSFTRSVLSTWPSRVPGKCVGSGRILLQEEGAYYCTEPGTSMSAPLVSAAAALLMSIRPNLTNDQVETILEESARDINLSAIEAGAGLLDAEMALRHALSGQFVMSPASIVAAVPLGAEPFTQTVIIENPSLAPVTVVGSIPASQWYRVLNIAGDSFSTEVSHGRPLYLTVAISPTHLSTGRYVSQIPFDLTYADGSGGSAALQLSLGVDVESTRVYLPMITSDGGNPTPSPIPFVWETPVVTPTVLSIGGGGSVKVTLPFVFPLSGVDGTGDANFTDAYVFEDGFVAFTAATIAPPQSSQGQCLPVLTEPGQAIFGWWADLDASRAGSRIVTFQPAVGRFVIQYEAVASAAGITPPYTTTFQIVLHANGDVGLNYLDVPTSMAQTLGTLTPLVVAGVQARNGLFHNQVACITPTAGFGRPPHRELSILLKREDIF